MGVGAGLYMYDVVVKKFTFAISSPDEFLFLNLALMSYKPCVGLVRSICIPRLPDESIGWAVVGHLPFKVFQSFY